MGLGVIGTNANTLTRVTSKALFSHTPGKHHRIEKTQISVVDHVGKSRNGKAAIMFRNPRESVTLPGESVLPSIGRPPTPPTATSRTRNSSPYFGPAATPTPKLAGMKAQRIQPQAGSRSPASARKPSLATSNSKTRHLPNQSILNFFAKSDRSEATSTNSVDDQELFFQDPTSYEPSVSERDRSNTPALTRESDHNLAVSSHETRYNESSSPVKRRRIGSREATQTKEDECALQSAEQSQGTHTVDDTEVAINEPPKSRPTSTKPRRLRGPFIEESDSEEEQGRTVSANNTENHNHRSDVVAEGSNTPLGGHTANSESRVKKSDKSMVDDVAESNIPRGFPNTTNDQLDGALPTSTERPSLTCDSASILPADEFEGMGDFEDEFFEEGEEYLEKRWLEEQRMFEEGLDEDSKSESVEEGPITPRQEIEPDTSCAEAATCPICNESMEGTTDAEASAHVNGCLDGKPTPLPTRMSKPKQCDAGATLVTIPGAKRFQRAAIARPGQENPFSLSKDASSGSAFSKLMSGHAEDAAWATAAANEVSSRGKPAYQRTCPFYKIMPGLYICVDAFRYGKVDGQNAYFLSHFHSDHYIGLTSSWCHGPIYCSKVTANLVRQQLKVESKWVVPLEFEKKVEIPGTQGVFVTMIPANHCPGSSLYLFEKIVGRGTNPKINRILHCGDFRACPAHVNHPRLRPDVLDAISGKTKQQMIDTCYLDTTYLTPKYAFPSQEDVISSCAEMCVSLSKEILDSNDGWERARLERAGSGMAKFLEKGTSEEASLIKQEDSPHIKKEEGAKDMKPNGLIIKEADIEDVKPSGLIKKEADIEDVKPSGLIKKKADIEDVKPNGRGRLLVVIGTYSIGKERVCLGIAKALNSKIYAPVPKQRICAALEDPELSSRLTTNPLEAQVHMQMLMEIRAETLLDYLQGYKSHFSRVVGFRPTGWNYRPPTSRFTENPAVSTVLHSEGWKSRFTMKDLVPQRGSTRESSCFGVPYSEHSSFRELTMFCCALRIGRVIPTVNVGSAKSREKMKMWVEKWEAEKKKSGLFKVEGGATAW
jgi:DNA cross-link repair 1A protein